MHSSRMSTARLLPVSPSMHWAGGSALRGMSAPKGGGCLLWGMCLLWGVSASGPRGVCLWCQGEAVCSGQCVCCGREGVSGSMVGGCLPLVLGCLPLVPGEGGCLLWGMGVSGSREGGVVCIPACTGADITSPMNRMTVRCKSITFANFV